MSSLAARAWPFWIRPLAILLGAALLLVHSIPLVVAYGMRLQFIHGRGAFVLAAGALAGFVLLIVAVYFRPRASIVGLCMAGLLLASLSGNLPALLIVVVILVLVMVLGDTFIRLLSGAEPDATTDLPSSVAAGSILIGVITLVAGEIHLLLLPTLLIVLLLVTLARWRRCLELFSHVITFVSSAGKPSPPSCHPERRARDLGGDLFFDAPTPPDSSLTLGMTVIHEACWIAFVAAACFATWVMALSPDTSWDGVAYHLPEIRDLAERQQVVALVDLKPQSLFWRNHDTFLALGYLVAGEKGVRLLHFFAGLISLFAVVVFGKRLNPRLPAALVLLGIVAFPIALYQLRATYVDWAAAFLVSVAATQLTWGSNRRVWLAGFFFGGAIVTKIFAILAGPALVLLWWRRGPRTMNAFLGGVVFLLLPMLPWMQWSTAHAGFPLAPYASSVPDIVNKLTGGYFFLPTEGAVEKVGVETVARRTTGPSWVDFLLLPYNVTFHSSRFEAFRNGYFGAVALLLLLGVFGWSWRGILFFLLAALLAVVPWYHLYEPSIRYLFPVYPLYVVFVTIGLWRMTGEFRGNLGSAAGISLVVLALAFPVQFGSSGREWKVALGLLDGEQAVSDALPAKRLWKHIRPGDRLIFIGEEDRYHCPAAIAWRASFSPVNDWGSDVERWREGMKELGITHILYRDEWSHLKPVITGLGDTLELVEKNRTATLFRVRTPERPTKNVSGFAFGTRIAEEQKNRSPARTSRNDAPAFD